MEDKTEKEPQTQLADVKDGSKDMEANPSNAEPKEWKNSSFFERIGIIRRYITVEPMLACYIMPSVIASIAVQNLNLEKACRVNQNYSTELCDDIITQRLNGSIEEVEVQKLVAYMGAWRLPLQTALPAIMILFIGPWSDRTGKRKPCMLVPILGEFLTAVGLIFCTYYFLQWPLEVAGVIEALPPALTGGYATMFLGIFTYLADNTTPEERTFRIGVVNTFISLALPVGMALSGTLLNAIGFYGVFTISIAFYGAAFLYGYFGIHDKKVVKEVDTNHQKELTSCTQFFSLVHVWDTFMVIFKKRATNRRLQTILLVVCYILVSGPVHGAGSVQYYYARRAYQFNEVDFSIFSSYTIIVNFVGVMFALSVLSKYFQMNDCLLAAIACFSKVMGSFVYAFAPSKEWMYLGPIVELMGGTAVIAMRSMATKVVNNNEVGKINSVFGVCEALVNTIYGPIFAAFYAQTVETFPGAFCILSAFLLAPSVAIFLYMYKLQKVDDFNGDKDKEAKDNPGFEKEMSHL